MHNRKITSVGRYFASLFLGIICAFFLPCFANTSASSTLQLSPEEAQQLDATSETDPRSQAEQDYLRNVSSAGLYCWPPTHLPVRVFFQIDSGIDGFKMSYPKILASCFDEWVQASEGKLAWCQAASSKEADIICRWTDQVKEGTSGTEAGRTRTYATLNTLTNCGVIHRGEITLLTRLPEREFTAEEVRKSYLHEIGHVFGIPGHSSNCGDMMYFSVSGMINIHLSERDKATINRLYRDYQPLNLPITREYKLAGQRQS
jgi:predicted Zn-dependent protease